MKKIFITFLIAISSVAFSQEKKVAELEKFNDLYIYSFAKPVNQYKLLGDFNVGLRNKDYIIMVTNAVEKAKKLYPEANGLIIEISNSLGSITFQAIKLE
jgi:hypothetical protein